MSFDLAGTLSFLFFDLAVPALFSLSFVVFIWGMFLYFIPGGHDEAAKEKGKSIMLYGILIYAGMVAFWSIITFAMQVVTNG
jgi:hypothetical protein